MSEDLLENLEPIVEEDSYFKLIKYLSAIAAVFNTVHIIDLKTNNWEELNSTRIINCYIDHSADAINQMRNIISHICEDNYVKPMLDFTDLTTVSQRLKDKKSISEEFISKINGWVRAMFFPIEKDENGYPELILFATRIIESEKRHVEKLTLTANTDELTGLLNRHAYENALKEKTTLFNQKDFVFVSLDVNGLKNVNDNLGHEAGDELLKGAAACMTKVFSPYGKIFRIGGDEFIILLFADSEKLNELKNKFNSVVANWKGTLVKSLAISCGYVEASLNPDIDCCKIENLADKKMYEDKSLYYQRKGIDRRGQQEAFTTLCHSYTKILKVNLSTDKFSVIQMNLDEKNETSGYNSESFSAWMHDFALSGKVAQEDTDYYLAKTKLDFLRGYFKQGNESLCLHYHRKIKDSFTKVMMEMIPSKEYTDDNQVLFLYVKDIQKH